MHKAKFGISNLGAALTIVQHKTTTTGKQF